MERNKFIPHIFFAALGTFNWYVQIVSMSVPLYIYFCLMIENRLLRDAEYAISLGDTNVALALSQKMDDLLSQLKVRTHYALKWQSWLNPLNV